MALAPKIQELFEDQDAVFELITHARTGSALHTAEAAHVPGDLLVKGVLLSDAAGYVLAVIPATHHLEVERLNGLTGRGLALVKEEEIHSVFSDCEPGSVPPFGDLYGVETLVDYRVEEQPEVYFEAGSHGELVRMSSEAFRVLLGDCARVQLGHHL